MALKLIASENRDLSIEDLYKILNQVIRKLKKKIYRLTSIEWLCKKKRANGENKKKTLSVLVSWKTKPFLAI